MYAGCQDYRPGMSRAVLEDEQRKQRIRDGLDPEPEAAPGSARRRSGGPGEDGSFSRSGAGFLYVLCRICCVDGKQGLQAQALQ